MSRHRAPRPRRHETNLGRRITLSLLLSGVALSPYQAGAEPKSEVAPGSVVRWSGEGTESCRIDQRQWMPRQGSCYYPIDLRRTGVLDLVRVRKGNRETMTVRIGSYPYRVQHIKLADDTRVHLSPRDLERVQAENRRISALWRRQGPSRFDLPLAPPLDPLPEGGRFGAKRIFNGEPRSPHSGADYPAPAGTPVRAVARGVVALAEEHFFGGNSVFVDHGDGLITMYLHLTQIEVEKGTEVDVGSVLGTVGSTGRATGPHLHFGVRWQGSRVDPRLLLEPKRIREVGRKDD